MAQPCIVLFIDVAIFAAALVAAPLAMKFLERPSTYLRVNHASLTIERGRERQVIGLETITGFEWSGDRFNGSLILRTREGFVPVALG
ncbi:MAG: hypothetical protein AAFY81_10855, partial [Pseudomonadota bacterium]